MCSLCEEYEEMQSCENCGRFVCYDIKARDDISAPAYVTGAGDLYCDVCGKAIDRLDEAEF